MIIKYLSVDDYMCIDCLRFKIFDSSYIVCTEIVQLKRNLGKGQTTLGM